MTLTAPPAATQTATAVSTPRMRDLASRGRFWIGLAAALVVIGLAAIVVLGSGATGGAALGADNAQQSGSKALVQVLRANGVRVVVADSLKSARRTVSRDPGSTTLLAYDASSYLDTAEWRSLAAVSQNTVLLDPTQKTLNAVVPEVTRLSAALEGTLQPHCDLPAFAHVQRITGDGAAFTVSTSGAVTCVPPEAGRGYGVVSLQASAQSAGSGTVTVVGTTSALTNADIGDHDDAAFALALLGASPTLVWYLPTPADIPKGGGTLASLTPHWVTPSIALLAIAAIVAAVWRGRRLGPLVVENLPVIVRSTETMEGRARLYERGGSRTHALDQIRIGTIGRLAEMTGLPRSAGLETVVHRVAALLGVDAGQVRFVLVDAVPTDDRRLVTLSDSLRDLEQATRRAVTPSVSSEAPASAPPASTASSSASSSAEQRRIDP